MKIRELIETLKKHQNQDAFVSIVVGDDDENYLDTRGFEVHCLDVWEYVELFVHSEKI